MQCVIQKNTQDIVRKKFAEALLQNSDRDLWMEVHTICMGEEDFH